MKNIDKGKNVVRLLFLLALSPILFTIFVLGFSIIILIYSLLFCLFVFSLCVGLISILYGLDFFVSLFSNFTFALFEIGVCLFGFGFASLLCRQLNHLIHFSNHFIKWVYKKGKSLLKEEQYAQ